VIEYLNPKQIPGTRLRVIKYSKLKALALILFILNFGNSILFRI